MTTRDFPPSPKGQGGKLLNGGWTVVSGGSEPPAAESQEGPAMRARALREKAEEVRKAAERMVDEEARRSLSGVAEQFERLAGRVSCQQDRVGASDD